jgi:hypothetical protein
VTEPLCRHLRWKSAAQSSADPEEVAWSLRRRRVPFSCLRTCEAWGPDDELVAPEDCTPDRPCFVAREPGSAR